MTRMEIKDHKRRTQAYLTEQVDASGIGMFRCLFGFLLVFSSIRYWLNGWIDEILLSPKFHFTYYGFSWVQPWSANIMYIHFLCMIFAATMIMVGYRTRFFSLIFCFLFTYVELIEKSAYLNHYYLVSLLSFLLILLPSDENFSIQSNKKGVVGRYVYIVLQIQVAIVYLYAGIAKINMDWLLEAQPLATWLQAYNHIPIIGHWFSQKWLAYLMSWFGMFFDCTIIFWLLWSKTRWWAYIVLVVFHFSIWILFPVGVFSFLMMISATVFFAPDWCRSKKSNTIPIEGRVTLHRFLPYFLIAHLLIQILLPIRHFLYGNDVNWTEDGFRFAWRVMLIEKVGSLEYRVQADQLKHEIRISPRKELTELQYKMIGSQPDMIVQYAHHIKEDYQTKGFTNIRVFADSTVWFNARTTQSYIRSDVDLSAVDILSDRSSWMVDLQNE